MQILFLSFFPSFFQKSGNNFVFQKKEKKVAFAFCFLKKKRNFAL